MPEEKPTAAEKADAADRLADAIDEANAALRKCSKILEERQPQYSWTYYPMFSEGDKIYNALRTAREALIEAARPISHQGFTEARKAKKNG